MSTRKRSSTEKHGKASKIKKTADCKDTGKGEGDVIHAGSSDVKVAASSPLQTKSLEFSFYNQSCEDLAKALLGKKLVRLSDKGERLCGIISETEAYLGHPDKAAHSYKGKTNKNEPMFMDPGTAYVYNIHSYCCMNISSKGEGAAVLLRALEPIENTGSMEKLRQKRTPGKSIKHKDLCNGPSKLCLSLDITKDQINKEDMTKSPKIWLENGDEEIESDHIVHCKRINIGYAEEWIDKPLRFYILGNTCVSKVDKRAECGLGLTS